MLSPGPQLCRDESACLPGCCRRYRCGRARLWCRDPESSFHPTVLRAAPDLVAHLRQPAAPSPDRACPLAPHAVVMGSCQRRAAPVRNALRRVQGLEAAFWGTIAVLAAAPATRACLRDGHTCYGDVRPVVRRFATSRCSVGGEPRPAGECDELSNNIESWTHATSTRLHGRRIRHAETNLRRRLDP